MAFNNLSQDVSLQQFPELWESSRFTQRQDPIAGDHAESYHDKLLPDESQENMELRRSLQSAAITGDEASKGKDQGHSEDHEEHHLMENEAEIHKNGAPTWLNSALLRQRNQAIEDAENDRDAAEKWCPVCSATGSESCMCGMPMHAGDTTTMSFPNQTTYTHWLSIQGAMHASHRVGELDVKDSDFSLTHPSIRMATELNLSPAGHGRDGQQFLELRHSVAGPSYAGDYGRVEQQVDWEGARQKSEWEYARNKAMVVAHPLYPDLLAAHANCLRVGTPVDQLPHIEAQLAQAHHVANKYSVLHLDELDITPEEKFELDQFMTQYIMFLNSFKENLQQHVYCEVSEAMLSCWDLEQSLHALTGYTPGPGTGATMSDDEEEYDSDYNGYEPCVDPNDSGGFGPLVPTETERTLMERVRQELKYELKQGYRARIVDVREEILRKRRAGKLPDGTTTVLKAWWQAHSKWPYPTEDEKERLIQETGLELKQVNNWFINQRKRNWHSNPLSASSELKNKRKSW